MTTLRVLLTVLPKILLVRERIHSIEEVTSFYMGLNVGMISSKRLYLSSTLRDRLGKSPLRAPDMQTDIERQQLLNALKTLKQVYGFAETWLATKRAASGFLSARKFANGNGLYQRYLQHSSKGV